MTDREKIIAWLRDDSNGDRVAAYRTIFARRQLTLTWDGESPTVLHISQINDGTARTDLSPNLYFVLPSSGPWEPTPAKVVYRGSGWVFGRESDEDVGWLCESNDAVGIPEEAMMLDIALVRKFIESHTPFKVTIEADGVGAHTESSPSDIIDPTGLFQAFKVIAYHNPEAPEDMPAHVTPEQTAALRLILDEVQEWL